MKLTVSVLCIAALIPFVLSFEEVPLMHVRPFEGPAYVPFCMVSGLLWCALFTLFFVRSSASERKKMLWLLPLVLFAFSFPAAYVTLWLAFAWAEAHGRYP
jgi:hypothetical protein